VYVKYFKSCQICPEHASYLQVFSAVVSCYLIDVECLIKGPWSPKLTYTFYPFSWNCRILW